MERERGEAPAGADSGDLGRREADVVKRRVRELGQIEADMAVSLAGAARDETAKDAGDEARTGRG